MRIKALLVATPLLALALFGGRAAAFRPGLDIVLDPAQGDALAHAALPKATDMPGDNWKALFLDDFYPAPPPDTPECAASVTAIRAYDDSLAPKRAGRANENLRHEAGDVFARVVVTVQVYEDEATLSDAVSKLQQLYTSPAFVACALQNEQQLDPDETMTAGTLLAPPHPDGFAVATDDVSLGTPEHREYYFWVMGNVSVLVDITGNSKDVTPDLVNGALSSTLASIIAAGKK